MSLNTKASPFKLNSAWKVFTIIFLVNLLQAILSPLLNDEPYYWLYAQYPSWGYFDHPPMIAFLIRLGTFLLPGEIGVRLFGLILGSLTFFLIYQIIESETVKSVNYKLLGLLLFSSLFLNLYSFLAIPDTPLLFFAALFLYTYRRYLQNDGLLNAFILGVVAALLLYSKYHGILLIGFTVLSNIKLLRRPSFYVVFILTVLLFSPHIYWQIQHDYPTIRFQLLERTNNFNIGNVFSYIGEQAGVTGPVILLLFSILYKPKNQFQKTLKYNVVGIFVFFLVSSFKEMVNVHWTGIAWPSMLCLAYLFIDDLKRGRRYITWLLVFNLLIVLVFRLDFIINFFQVSNFNDKNPLVMARELNQRSGGHPLVFKDAYNEPSYIMFYTHQHSFAVNNIWYKKTQFNYLPALENEFQSKTVSLVSNDPINNTSQKIHIKKGKKYFITTVTNFSSFSTGVKINAQGFKSLNSLAESEVTISIESDLDAAAISLFKQKGGYLVLALTNKKNNHGFAFSYNGKLNLSNKDPFQFTFKAPAEKGDYTAVFSLVTKVDNFLVGFNSNTYNVEVR